MKTTSWLVVGAGAIGLLWTCKLKKLNFNVHLVYRNQSPGNLLSLDESLASEENSPTFSEHKIKSFQASQLNKSYDKVLFCTKAYDLLDAYQSVQAHLTKDADIACLCNGLGFQERLQQKLQKNQTLWAGTTSEGALKIAPNKVKHTGLGDTYFGRWCPTKNAKPFPLPSFEVANIHQRLVEKLAINAIINPITAIYGIQNGDILSPDYEHLFKNATRELAHFFTQSDFSLLEHSQHLNSDNLINRISTVAQLTRLNRSSMHEDLRLKRQTENEFISGYLVSQSKNSLPIQAALHQAVAKPEQREEIKKKLLNTV
ncbi:ketopantoate reductase family protein [Marinomonas pollencensis]|uniref:2-dehydropantoate 2-reductase n=1 Tax=Marinomonas pollencensis TaxID=491954 RepID=A0A3E0DKX4_9GAMM|nr:2-dehydropantoate 2-reductase [Marinomonas pollencensis]REG83283.1 ketopantoate reductase [Marinomonas pollencensis]